MNKLRIIFGIAALILIVQVCTAYTIQSDSVFMEDSQASLRVTPHTAQFPSGEGYRQEFELCNKTETTTDLYGAYVFDKDLIQRKAEYLVSEDYEWVEHEKECFWEFDYITNVNPEPNIHQGECYYILSGEKITVFDMAFKTGDQETKTIQYDINELVKNWSNITGSFEKKNINGKSVYAYTAGKEVSGNSCETWRITYKPNETDTTEKWDLWLWVNDTGWDCILTDDCQKILKLDPWWDGTGTVGDPFIITDCNQLQTMDSYTRNNRGLQAYFELGNDIDCEGFDWTTIGSAVTDFYFSGYLDGKNYSISDLTVTSTGVSMGATFIATLGEAGGGSTGGEIRNVAFIDFNSWNSGENGAGIIGRCVGCVIDNVYSQGGSRGTSGSYAGGISATCQNDASITNSYVVDVTVSAPAGATAIGGIFGVMECNDGNVVNSYSNALVNSTGGSPGGLVGAKSGGDCIDSFWDTQTSAQAASACGTGLTTANMFKEASFTNWDFSTIWAIEEDVNYATLQSFVVVDATPPTIYPISLNDFLSVGDFIDGKGYFHAIATDDTGVTACNYTINGTDWFAATWEGVYCISPVISINDQQFYSFNFIILDAAANSTKGIDLNYTGKSSIVDTGDITDDDLINVGFIFMTNLIIGVGILALFLIFVAILVLLKTVVLKK